MDKHQPAFRAHFQRAVDSSATLRTCTRVVRGSVLCRGLALLAPSVSPASSYIWSRVRPVSPPGDFRHTIQVLADSRMYTLVEGFCRGMRRAWNKSVIRNFAFGLVPPLESWQRVRLLGWALPVSTIVRVVLRPSIVSGKPLQLAGWLVPFLLGVVLMWGARPITAAWADRTRRSARLANR